MSNEYDLEHLNEHGYYVVWDRTFDSQYGPVLFEIRCFRIRDGIRYFAYTDPVAYPIELKDGFGQVNKVKNMLNSGQYNAYNPVDLCKEMLG